MPAGQATAAAAVSSLGREERQAEWQTALNLKIETFHLRIILPRAPSDRSMSSSSSQQSRSHGVPIRRDGFSVMDTEFDNIRERFDSEMRRMEDEMNKFRGEMMASMDGDVFKEHKSSKQSR